MFGNFNVGVENLQPLQAIARGRLIKLGCHRQRLLSSPLERGVGGVSRETYTPLYPLFLEGNHNSLKFLNI